MHNKIDLQLVNRTPDLGWVRPTEITELLTEMDRFAGLKISKQGKATILDAKVREFVQATNSEDHYKADGQTTFTEALTTVLQLRNSIRDNAQHPSLWSQD